MKQSVVKHLVIALAALTSLSGTFAVAQAGTVSAAGTPCVNREFASGNMNDKCVGYIQSMVNEVSDAKLRVDNDYGPKTKAAVKVWQDTFNNRFKAAMPEDGITGTMTWASLCIYRDEYKSKAKAAGCNQWSKDIDAFWKNHKKPAKTTSATKTRDSRTSGNKACTQQHFSISKSNRNSTCAHYLKDMLNIATGSELVVSEPYNRETRTVVKAFQGNYDVKDSRGVVGKRTWTALCGHLAPNGSAQAKYNGLKQKVGCEQL